MDSFKTTQNHQLNKSRHFLILFHNKGLYFTNYKGYTEKSSQFKYTLSSQIKNVHEGYLVNKYMPNGKKLYYAKSQDYTIGLQGLGIGKALGCISNKALFNSK